MTTGDKLKIIQKSIVPRAKTGNLPSKLSLMLEYCTTEQMNNYSQTEQYVTFRNKMLSEKKSNARLLP